MGYVIFTTLAFFYSLVFYCARQTGRKAEDTEAGVFVRNRF
ncbi:MAG: hypothetical protein KatS3mg032_1918 [Cyclobacteriaceae bacterium]|nr:MAG: hypothetical protein KatS3mg032_1918 [Cyclobacteriaceae bacterium]